MNMRFLMILPMTFLGFSSSVQAAGFCAAMIAEKCVPRDANQELYIQTCETEMKAANCEKFYQENPEAGKTPRNCEQHAVCLNHGKLQDYGGACLAGIGENLKDLGVGAYHFVVDEVKMSPEMAEREEYFKQCTSADCKRELLGPYVGLFSKAEIEGQPYDAKLYPEDPLYKNHLQGKSAKTLYHELLVKLQKKFENKTLDEPFIEPWSGEEAKFENSKTLNEMIDGVLEKSGVHNTACYTREALSEMRCYALMTLVDPFVVVKGIAAISRIAGVASRVVARAPKTLEEAKRLKELAVKKAAELKTSISKYGSDSVYHRYSKMREYPELIKNIDMANRQALKAKFPKQVANVKDMENIEWQQYAGNFVKKGDAEKLGTRFKELDPEIQSSIHGVFNKMNNKHTYIDYMEKLNSEAVAEIKSAGIPRELEYLKKQGKVSENAYLRALAKRAESRGQTNLSGLVPNEQGELMAPKQIRNSPTEIDLGPQVNRPYNNEKRNITHLLQEDYVADVVQESTKGKPQKFWNFLDSKEGQNFWVPLFDSTHRSSLTNPAVNSRLTHSYSK
jgi:hypothetical protein